MSKIFYAIYVDDNCNEGFYEENRFEKLNDAQRELIKLRKERKFEDFWLVVILDE